MADPEKENKPSEQQPNDTAAQPFQQREETVSIPSYFKNPFPIYPKKSRRRGEEGTVILRVKVDPQGTPESIDIQASSGFSELDHAAIETVRQWKFKPAETGGKTTASTVAIPIVFKIENR